MQEKHLKVRTQAVVGEGTTQGTVRVVTLDVGPPRPALSISTHTQPVATHTLLPAVWAVVSEVPYL